MSISHLVALDHTPGHSHLRVSSKVRRANLVIYSSPMLELGREKNAVIERGASVKEQLFTSWIGVNYSPSSPTRSANVLLIQYLAAGMFFSCSVWVSVKIRRLWFSERYEGAFPVREQASCGSQEVVILSQQWSICQLKRKSLTRASCWTYNSSLLEWKGIELLLCCFSILHGGLPVTVNLCIIALSDRRNGSENLPA